MARCAPPRRAAGCSPPRYSRWSSPDARVRAAGTGLTAGRPRPVQRRPASAHILSFRPLAGDLAQARTTPAFSFIVPNLCDDGHDVPCVTGAYRDGGLIVVTFDEGSDAAACCGEASGFSAGHPNVPEPGKNGPGGGRAGAVLLSPLIRPGTVSTVAYNHYSLLRTVEDIFGLPHLGDAAMPQVRSFGPDVFG